MAALTLCRYLSRYLQGEFANDEFLGVRVVGPLLGSLAFEALILYLIARRYYWITLLVVVLSFLGAITSITKMFSAGAIGGLIVLVIEMSLELVKALVARVALMRISRERAVA